MESEKSGFVRQSPPFTLGAHNLFFKKSIERFPGSKPAYSMQIRYDKKEDVTIIKDAIQYVWDKACISVYKKSVPLSAELNPLKDGDDEVVQLLPDNAWKKGLYLLNARSKIRPEFFDKSAKKYDLGENEGLEDIFYPGAICRAALLFITYNTDKTNIPKGVSCIVCGVQKLRDGEPLRNTPSLCFEAFNDSAKSDGILDI